MNDLRPADQEELLPLSESALDQFVSSITEEYQLPPGDDTYDAIATMIMHLPQTRAFVPRSYFGNGVRKSMANRAAYNRLRDLAQKRKDAEEAEIKNQKADLTLVENSSASVPEPVQNA